jgi:hypothetical protein
MNREIKFKQILIIPFCIIVGVLFAYGVDEMWNEIENRPTPKIQTEIVTTIRDTILNDNANLSTIIYENKKFVCLKNGKHTQLILIGDAK